MYRGKARRADCTNQRHEGSMYRGKNVLIIGHEEKTVQTEGKEGRLY